MCVCDLAVCAAPSLAAVAGKTDYVVKFTGSTVWNYVKDVARVFIECAREVAERCVRVQ